MWCWFFPRHLLGSHSGKRDGIWICTCTNTDMQEVLKDAHISYITVITSFCSAPLFQCFQPRTCHSPLLQLLFQLDTFFFSNIYEEDRITSMLTLYILIPWWDKRSYRKEQLCAVYFITYNEEAPRTMCQAWYRCQNHKTLWKMSSSYVCTPLSQLLSNPSKSYFYFRIQQ